MRRAVQPRLALVDRKEEIHVTYHRSRAASVSAGWMEERVKSRPSGVVKSTHTAIPAHPLPLPVVLFLYMAPEVDDFFRARHGWP